MADTKRASTVGEMAPIDLLVAITTNSRFVKTAVSVMHSKVKCVIEQGMPVRQA